MGSIVVLILVVLVKGFCFVVFNMDEVVVRVVIIKDFGIVGKDIVKF